MEAEAEAERFEERGWSAELQRLRGVFLAAVGADETQVEASALAGTTRVRLSRVSLNVVIMPNTAQKLVPNNSQSDTLPSC